ncbi:helix-turn-helix protein [compost metagenome]
MKTIGNKIRKVRELRNYSRSYVAKELGIGINSYGKIERNEVSITLLRLEELAEILQVSVVCLISFDEDKLLQA